MLNKIIVIMLMSIIAIFTSDIANASPVDTFEFKDEVTKVRFQALSKELRCPKCQNQNLADSNSPIAADLRRELYELLQQGKADSEVVDFMVNRYGEFVLYRPRVSNVTYILWFGPALLILIGVIVVIVIIRKKPVSEENLALSAEQQEKLKQLLSERVDDSSPSTSVSAKADKE
ncbi:MAG: cytochrome c-type biogenesis protein CcmH [Colwellia sp.]|nr:cytochrome c-type biogenesis protein CcmH [Colwellia sp.]MCW9082648.1 cytochrome c-type biogenesis protein CcmH [Colwellia sp.]